MSLPTLGIVNFLRLLPSRLSLGTADALGRLAWLSARRRRYGRAQIKLALPDLTPQERDRILKRSCGHLGRTAVETMVVSERLREAGLQKCLEFEPGALEQLTEVKGQGAILIQGHLGAFELFGGAATFAGLNPAFTMRMPTNYYVGRRLIRSRQGWGIKLIPRQGAVRPMLKHLRSGGAVVLATDQNAQRAPIFVPWFGKEAATERAAAGMALRTGAPVLVCWCVRTSRLDNNLVGCVTLRPASPQEASTDEAVRALTQEIHSALETVIRQYPEQYLWIHDRYRTRPDDHD
jgi:KDO2-lipid IV(A) lauroyltransferase